MYKLSMPYRGNNKMPMDELTMLMEELTLYRDEMVLPKEKLTMEEEVRCSFTTKEMSREMSREVEEERRCADLVKPLLRVGLLQALIRLNPTYIY